MNILLIGETRRAAEIAALAAASGVRVTLAAEEGNASDEFQARAHGTLAALVAAELFRDNDLDDAKALIQVGSGTTEPAAVVEACPENLAQKLEALRTAEARNPRVPFVTTTSVLSVGEIAASAASPGLVVGLSFPGAAHTNPVVERVAGRQTDPRSLSAASDLAKVLGKEVVDVIDRPGFLAQRLLVPYLNDVVTCLDEGLATPEDLDVALELGLGYPNGALMVLDEIGLDVHLERCDALYAQLGDAHFAAPALLRRMVDAGELGAVSGRGFRIGVNKEEQA